MLMDLLFYVITIGYFLNKSFAQASRKNKAVVDFRIADFSYFFHSDLEVYSKRRKLLTPANRIALSG